jgi:hypothetical protein
LGSRALRWVFLVVFSVALVSGVYLLVQGRKAAGIQAPDPYAIAYQGLCRAESVAPKSLVEARDVFYSQSHSDMHNLARETGPGNRALEARLLVAMNRVETDLADKSPRSAQSLGTLREVAQEALVFLRVPPKPCE